MLRIGPSSPERSSRDASRTCGERLPWNATTSSRPVRSRVAISAGRLVGRHHHRLLEQDVEAGLEAGRRLGEVEGVGRDDEDGVELGRRSVATNRRQSGSFGGAGRPCWSNSSAAAA